MAWPQIYDPFGKMMISTALAGVPVVAMLAALGFLHIKAHIAAGLGLLAAAVVALFAYGMPAGLAGTAAMYGGFTGSLPIGWTMLNIIFLQQMAAQNGSFKILQESLSGIAGDRRLQLLLIAFCFGAFFEGAAGFGTPVAVTAGRLIGLGLSPLAAWGLSLIANTAPVAFGALGTPVITLAKVHGYDLMEVTSMIGRQLPFFTLLVPFWLIWAFAGRKAMLEMWPAILVTGLSFAIPQYLVSNFIGPELVDIIATLVSMVSLILFLRVWQPKKVWRSVSLKGHETDSGEAHATTALTRHSRAELVRAWTPWLILTVFVFVWVLPPVKAFLNSLFAPAFPIEGLHNLVQKMPAAAKSPSKGRRGPRAEPVVGHRRGAGDEVQPGRDRANLAAHAVVGALLAADHGTDARVGFADAPFRHRHHTRPGVRQHRRVFPFFGTLMGRIDVAMTNSDTASNMLFGGMQRVAAEQLGLSQNLMGAANSSGGVMGKKIDAQSIVVASTATRWFNHEGDILRCMFFHSIALACLVGLYVTMQAYVWPFTLMVVH